MKKGMRRNEQGGALGIKVRCDSEGGAHGSVAQGLDNGRGAEGSLT